ncbi:PRC-barrel domain-containing protein [Rhodospirillaceae bacterium SYSU D60014]|uniref:PRC-barrel domain-containing protein n=1 Tax=Virgifigura deserti TaxID=2268457 RepID=UPI0013C468D1
MVKLLSTTAIILALAGPAWAQSSDSSEVGKSSYPFLDSAMTESNWGSDTLLGKPLVTADGEEIGEVEGIVFDENDQIAGIVVDAGGYLGVDTRPVVVDWYAVTVVPEDEMMMVDMTQEQLESAPEHQMTGDWREAKDANVHGVAESQPGVITGEDTELGNEQPGTEAGGTPH